MTEQEYKSLRQDFLEAINPFKSLDLRMALDITNEIGEDADWLAEQVYSYMEETGCIISEINIVFMLHYYISYYVREDLEKLLGLDEYSLDFPIHQNYIDTNHIVSDEELEKVEKAIKQKQINITELSEMEQWFLSSIGITW